jgi:hypothetical protein
VKKSSIGLIKLKSLNRGIQLALDERRKEVELKRARVDSLQLTLENLRYRESYLQKDIASSKSLVTPHLTQIEKELQQPLGTLIYTENIKEVNDETIETLKNEQRVRIDTLQKLEETTKNNSTAEDIFDKKRKFMDDLPLVTDKIEKEASALHSHLSLVFTDNEGSTSLTSL